MVVGHYSTALVAYELTRETQRTPLWVFLLAAQFLDILMLTLVSVGIEKLTPANFFDLSFAAMQSDMFVSHDILPVTVWAMLFGLIVWAITKKYVVSLWCVGLIFFHEICDLVVGFQHYIIGDTGAVGFALYNNAPVIGLILEALMCVAIVFWFCRRRDQRGQPVSHSAKWGLYGILAGSTLLTLPLATQSLNSLLGL